MILSTRIYLALKSAGFDVQYVTSIGASEVFFGTAEVMDANRALLMLQTIETSIPGRTHTINSVVEKPYKRQPGFPYVKTLYKLKLVPA